MSPGEKQKQAMPQTHVSCFSCIGRRILHHWATREANDNTSNNLKSPLHETVLFLKTFLRVIWWGRCVGSTLSASGKGNEASVGGWDGGGFFFKSIYLFLCWSQSPLWVSPFLSLVV